MIVKLTKHAKVRLKSRGLTFEDVENAIKNYDISEPDKFNPSLIHYIKKINDKFLRVIAKWEDERTLSVISAFYDRRIKKKYGG